MSRVPAPGVAAPQIDGSQDLVASTLLELGATKVPGTALPNGSVEELITDAGVGAPSPQEPTNDVASVLAQFGGTKVEPTPAVPLTEPESGQEPGQNVRIPADDMKALSQTRAALVQEGIFIRDKLPEGDPRRARMEANFVDRWVEQGFQEREEELANRVTFGGVPVKNDPAFRNQISGLRTLEETANRWVGNIQSTAARIAGDEKKAIDITRAVNDLQEYNRILDRHSALGKTAGPLFGQISSSLGTSTLNAATGGLSGVAGLFALEDFNEGMAENATLDPVDRWQHATMKSAITFATTLLGGQLAQRAGVASGDSVIPFFGKTVSELFTKTGLAKAGVAAGIEAGEEGVQSLLSNIEDANSGVNPNATDNLFDRVLQDASVGAFVGTVAQAGSVAGKYDLPTQHYRDVVDGWLGRLRAKPETRVDPAETSTPGLAPAEGVAGHAVTPEGTIISRKAVDDELSALQELEAEVNQQFESGGATELKQVIAERQDSLRGVDEEIKTLTRDIAKWKAVGVQSRVDNLQKRKQIAEKYRQEVQDGLDTDQKALADWTKEFDSIHKQEREFIDAELNRLTEQKELPNAAPDADTLAAETKTPQEGEATGAPESPSKAPPESGQSEGAQPGTAPPAEPETSQFDDISESMSKARQRDVNRVRDFLGLDTVPARDRQSTDFAFAQAIKQGLPDQALEMANGVLQEGKLLDPTQLAGLQTRYVGVLDQITDDGKFLEDNPDLSQDGFNARNASIEAGVKEIETLTEAWIRSSSEVGAALQAQKRALGVTRSAQRALVKARKLKGEALTGPEVKRMTDVSEDVQKAADALLGLERGTDAYDRADFELATAMMEQDAAVANMEPGSSLLKGVEAFNATRMALTLSGDLVPLGRQGFFNMLTNPKQTLKNMKQFFKPLLNKSVKEAEFQSFLVERNIREMENFKTLRDDFGVPVLLRHTPYTQAEGSSIGRMREALGLRNIPGAQFDIAYRSWLNQTRFTMADLAFRQNKEILNQPGGKQEMESIINHVLHSTGHTKTDFGKGGQILMTAPKWFMSRLALPLKATYHIPRGLWSVIQRKPNSSTWVAKQYAKAAIGATMLSYGMEGVASLLFGADNVNMDRDPSSPEFGYLTINGRRYDLTGGMGFVVRQGQRAFRGTREFLSGEVDKVPDSDFGQSLGGTIAGRSSPIFRDIAYLFQSGRPLGAKERMAVSEYVIRNTTFLSAQEIFDAAKGEGLGQAGISAMMEMFGFSGFEKRQSK